MRPCPVERIKQCAGFVSLGDESLSVSIVTLPSICFVFAVVKIGQTVVWCASRMMSSEAV
jgi:hypothetical protein